MNHRASSRTVDAPTQLRVLRTSRRFAFILALLLLLGAPFQACRLDTATKEPTQEEQNLEYLLFLQPSSSVAACESSVTAALACANTAGGTAFETAYTTVLEATYSISIASPQAASDVCAVLPNAAKYPNPLDTSKTHTTGAKICFFDCDKAFWERQSSSGTCTAAGFTSLTAATDSQYQTCITNCLTRGTVFTTPPIDSTTPSPTLP